MIDLPNLARALAVVDRGLWRWEENDEAVAWATGRTIAFRTEIAGVADALGPYGLPPFSALVLMFAALRDDNLDWRPVDCDELPDDPELRAFVRHSLLVARDWPHARRVQAGLARLHDLPAASRVSLGAKRALAVALFSRGSLRSPPAVALAVSEALSRGDRLPRTQLVPAGPALAAEGFLGLRALDEALAQFDAAVWPTIFRTGLSAAPPPAPEAELPDGASIRATLQELREDPEAGAVARVALDLFAAAALPNLRRHDEELPVGGYADIANRGPLDRLLL
ncbi:MAG TPA: hypothetical protein VNC50_13515, partial [Planctomycetia bacterium]|nr:hypothetical protein [Planctomycetia bacterium]